MVNVVGSKKPSSSDAAAAEATTGAGDEVAATGSVGSKRPGPSVDLARVRTWIAQAIWVVCIVAATSLAVSALCIAVDANQNNGLVSLVLDLAGFFDLGVFTLVDGVMAFDGDNAETKNALVNYGLGAAFWLIVGRILERLIRP